MNVSLIFAEAAAGTEGGSWWGMLPMILIIGVMFYLMWRSQKKEQKRRQDMIEGIKKGDKIVTMGGIHAQITEIRDDFFKVKIAENTEIEIAKSAVGAVIDPGTKAEG